MADDAGWRLDPKGRDTFVAAADGLLTTTSDRHGGELKIDLTGNARFAHNVFEHAQARAIAEAAERFSGTDLSSVPDDQLLRITAADIEAAIGEVTSAI